MGSIVSGLVGCRLVLLLIIGLGLIVICQVVWALRIGQINLDLWPGSCFSGFLVWGAWAIYEL